MPHRVQKFPRLSSVTKMAQSLIRSVRPIWCGCGGFALFEMMIVLMIAGLLVGPGMKMWRLHRQQSAHRTTVSHQNHIFQALGDYWTLHGCLPWPSRLDGDQQGISQNIPAAGHYRGIVPYRTLGLPEKTARDGWGRWMVYWVDAVMTTPQVLYQETWCRICFSRPSVLDVLDEGLSVQQGIQQSPQNYRPVSGGSAATSRPRIDGIAVMLLADPDAVMFSSDSDISLDSTGPVVPITVPMRWRRLVQWRTRSQMFSAMGIHCVDSFFAVSPPTIERPSQSGNIPGGKVIMRPLPAHTN